MKQIIVTRLKFDQETTVDFPKDGKVVGAVEDEFRPTLFVETQCAEETQKVTFLVAPPYTPFSRQFLYVATFQTDNNLNFIYRLP